MTTIKKGATVRLVQPEIAGPVLDRRINADTDEIEVLVQFAGADGEQQQRWFAADRLEIVAEQEGQE